MPVASRTIALKKLLSCQGSKSSGLRVRTLSVLMLPAMLAGCGGGGGGDGQAISSNKRTLTPAANYREFVQEIQRRYPGSLDWFTLVMEYDHGVEEFPEYMARTNLDTNPVLGVWKHYAAMDYPSANGKLELSDRGFGRHRMGYKDLDLTNSALADGGAQAFYGVAPCENAMDGRGCESAGTTYRSIPVSILAEVIVRDPAGVDQYRALKSFVGTLPNYSPSNQGPPFDGTVGHLYSGYYRLIVLECYVALCQTGYVLEYPDYMDRSP